VLLEIGLMPNVTVHKMQDQERKRRDEREGNKDKWLKRMKEP